MNQVSKIKQNHNLPELSKAGVRNEIRIFIASPSDCLIERKKIRQILEELNQVFCNLFNVLLVPVGWEDLAPNLGEPQEVIDYQIETYDLFIGVMWLRFGTPTSSGSDSGTEHEFKSAHDLWEKTGKPRVMFYGSLGFRMVDNSL